MGGLHVVDTLPSLGGPQPFTQHDEQKPCNS